MTGKEETRAALEQLYEEKLGELYPGRARERVVARYLGAAEAFGRRFGGARDARFYSAPGRSEIGGNHTDHQGGCVVTASVDVDAIACAAKNGSGVIRLFSAGHGEFTVDMADREPEPAEFGKTEGLIRGVAARFAQLGHPVGGFDAYLESDVLPGSGLSSSAAFEVLAGLILNDLFCENALPAEELAKAGQYAENVYFGKPCGLQDQMASAVGGLVYIDFGDAQKPGIRRLPNPLGEYALCIIDSGGDHADLTPEYAAIPGEMGCVAGRFGHKVMRPVAMEDLLGSLGEVRRQCGDRAALRAFHFINENARAQAEAAALAEGRVEDFLALVRESGRSSWMYLQNAYPSGAVRDQAAALALAVCEQLLAGEGACRVHGGGFAGTVQAFVPQSRAEEFCAEYGRAMGGGMCHLMHIRPRGGVVVLGDSL